LIHRGFIAVGYDADRNRKQHVENLWS
jgi:hypothetical protein